MSDNFSYNNRFWVAAPASGLRRLRLSPSLIYFIAREEKEYLKGLKEGQPATHATRHNPKFV